METGPRGRSTGDHQRELIRQVRRRLASNGPSWTRGAPGDFERVTVPQRDCDALRDLLIAERAGRVVEVGLAYGSSALAIGEALVTMGTPHPLHIIIDPFQTTAWSGVGWRLLQDAELDATARLMLQPSSAALPQLVAEGVTTDAAFVDGSHRFHEVVIDLYFLRKIVRPSGVVVVDDDWWPSVGPAVRYYETNLGWRTVEGAFDDGTIDPASGRCRMRALRLPDPPFEPPFEHFRSF